VTSEDPIEPAIPAPSAPAGEPGNAGVPRAVSILGFAAAVAGLLVLFYNEQLFCRHPAGIAVQAAAVLLMVWARVTFGRRSFHAAADPTAGGLVTHGPYRYWRHPIYAAILYFAWAALACHPHLVAAGGAGLITLGLALRMAMEESMLRRVYPDYAAYAARTRRVIPFVV
jgi:protein-S-isoprenylcysteine O-methyltransferase Ste14